MSAARPVSRASLLVTPLAVALPVIYIPGEDTYTLWSTSNQKLSCRCSSCGISDASQPSKRFVGAELQASSQQCVQCIVGACSKHDEGRTVLVNAESNALLGHLASMMRAEHCW